jgi:selenocysteine lyase/cysteine desulfurase
VLRPLSFLAEHRGVSATYVRCGATGIVEPDEVRQAMTPQTKLVAIIHASNVTGSLQPVAAIAQLAKQHGVALLVDAAQSLGHVPINVNELGCDLLAAPGHKGLLGPLGTGLLYLSPGIEERLLPLRQGGTGTRSDEDVQPSSLPDRYESGNLNVPGIVGMEAGVSHLLDAGIDRCRDHESRQTSRLLEGLAGLPSVTLYGSRQAAEHVGVVSLNVAGYDPRELASLLDAQWSIQTRAGIHCAPRMHQALGTAPAGTLRLSIGHFTTDAEIDAALAALAEL